MVLSSLSTVMTAPVSIQIGSLVQGVDVAASGGPVWKEDFGPSLGGSALKPESTEGHRWTA